MTCLLTDFNLNSGRLVYSTCSMNPVEDEAVIAHAAKRVVATHRLISTSEMIPQLQRR